MSGMGALRKRWSRRWIVGTSVALSAALGVALVLVDVGEPASAQRRGRQTTLVYMVQKRIPAKLTEDQLLRWARSNSSKRLQETPEGEIRTRKWRFDVITNFRQPPNDSEFHILFYDIHDGPARFVRDLSMFVSDRTQRTYVQQVRLDRPAFRPNRNYEMVVTVRRQEVARHRFALLGEEEARSGEVSFSAEDTREPGGRRPGSGDSGGDGIERAAD